MDNGAINMVNYDNSNEVMTLSEVAEYLQLSEKSVLRMCQKGGIPGAKIASQWRFMRTVIRDWLAGQMQTMPSTELTAIAQHSKNSLSIHELMRPEFIISDLKAGPKEYVLKQLVDPMIRSSFARQPQQLLDSLIERERMMTTAIGHGIAIPHPRKPIEGMFPEPAVVLGICPEGVTFEALDDRLVHLFFVICSTKEDIHLQLMAKVSWLCRKEDIVTALSRAKSKTEVSEIIIKASKGLN